MEINHINPFYPFDCSSSSYFDQGANSVTNQLRPIDTHSKALTSIPVDVVCEILARLPVKDILKFRSVCKSWHFLTQEQHFIQRHLQIHKANVDDFGIISVPLSFYEKSMINFFSVNGFHKFDTTKLNKDRCCEISNSCDGLICAYGRRNTYLVNPTIKKAVELPELKPEHAIISVALVKINSTGEYKFFRFFRHVITYIVGLEALDLTTGIECEVFDRNSYSWGPVKSLPPLYDSGCVFRPVVVNGTIHWITGPSFEKIIVGSFDPTTETVSFIKEPEGFIRKHYVVNLLDFDGRLCIVASILPSFMHKYASPSCKKFWVLKDYENLTWEKIHICTYSSQRLYPVAVKNGKMLWDDWSSISAIYDIKKSSFISKFSKKEHYPRAKICSYDESLISPDTFVERNQG